MRLLHFPPGRGHCASLRVREERDGQGEAVLAFDPGVRPGKFKDGPGFDTRISCDL